MLRATSGILTRLAAHDTRYAGAPCALEFVRWRRKPRWLPVARSKLFRVPERKQQDPDERVELMRLHNNYKTQMRSLRQFMRVEAQRLALTSTAEHFVLTAEQEEAEYQRCQRENDAWNATIAAERAKRLAREREERIVYVQERLEAARERDEEQRERIEAIVRREKELSKTFITRENLDTAIAQALANPVDYNFAVDLSGNMYRGRKTLPGAGGDGAPATTTTTTTDADEKQQQKMEASN